MKEIYINADDYNSDSIRTIQGNNNAEEYKIYLQYDNEKIDLTNKTVNLAFLKVGSTDGDIIENLNVTDPVNGEITLKITNKLTRKNGTYSCQLAILGEEDFLEHTATFTLTVENNIFKDITKAIADSKDFTYLERILEEATNISEELKSNIPVARQLNIDLENQNRILNENMDRSNGVNNTLITTTEQSKIAATDAIEKKSQLEKSITKAKEFIDGLDGSQNIPSIRMELTELQNGLKNNQSLEYNGSSVSVNNTLEGRTDNMKISGRSLVNLEPSKNISMNISSWNTFTKGSKEMYKPNTKYTVVVMVEDNKLTEGVCTFVSDDTNTSTIFKSGTDIILTKESKGVYTKVCTTKDNLENCIRVGFWSHTPSTTKGSLVFSMMILEGDLTNEVIPSYFEGLKSFGEVEQEIDKYKISLLSCGKNIIDFDGYLKSKNITNKNNVSIPSIYGYIKPKYVKPNTQYDLTKIGFEKVSGTGIMLFRFKYTDGSFSSYLDTTGTNTSDLGKSVDFIEVTFSDNCYYNLGNLQLEEKTNSPIYEHYKEDRKDILIKEPIRSKDNICDLLYEDNGQVKIDRYVGIRKYQDGDEKNKDVMTDKINTVYILDKPVTEVVDGVIDIDLDTFGEKTYFNILNSLPGTLDFKVPSNIGSVVQNMAKEVNNIWDVINNLLVPSIVKANGNLAMIKLNNNLK
ncbi:BppU family phage baseplate upper protein [Clostridium perfringens]|uniref:BppU family phage baseplate upper protein n=1 Tax=Clostridium perfringens TaxID=1502 RepID=UPI001ABA58B1|nr:BppU family phage baseplate upper protein [Clostridium perfringens]MBO3312869.1 BppU family phage baseplate upper protein [Clostridium perfringens]